MRLRRIALWVTCGVLALLAACLLWLNFGDLSGLKPHVESWVSAKTGRKFAIEGRFDLDFGRETVVIAEGIQFANAEWAASQSMLDVGYLELRINSWSLLSAPLTIEAITLREAAVRLERPATGDPNWVVVPPPVVENAEADPGAFDVIVRHIDTENVQIVYTSPERTGPLELRIASLRQQHRADDFLELALAGDIDGRAININVVAGTWNALLAQENIAYDIDGQLDSFNISSQGTIDNLAAPRRPSLTFAASGPDINELLRMLQIEEGGSGDIDLKGSIQPGEGDQMVVDVAGRLGQTSIDATATLPDLRTFEQFEVTAQASSPDLSRILALFGVAGIGEAPFTIDAAAARQGPMLTIDRAHLDLADARFDLTARLPGFPSLDDGSASLSVVGADFARLRQLLQLPGKADGPYSLGMELQSDAAGEEILRVALTSTLANLEADGRVATDRNYAGSEFNFALTSDSLARVGKAYGMERLPDSPMTLSGSVTVEDDAIRLRGPVTARIVNTTLTVDGLVTRKPGLDGSRVSVGIETPNLADVAGMFASAEQVPPLPAAIDGVILVSGDGLRIDDVRGKLGQSSVAVAGDLKLTPQLAGSEFKFTFAGPAFEEVVAHIPKFDVLPGNYTLTGALAFGDGSVRLDRVKLVRPRGEATADATIGLSQPSLNIDFSVGARGGSVRSILPSLGEIELDDQPFAVTARGGLRGASLTLAKFDAQVGEARMAARGDVDLEIGGRSTDFEFDMQVPDLASLGLLDNRRPREQSLSVTARIRGDHETLIVDNLVARLGESDIRGALRLEKGDVPTLGIELRSDSLYLAPLLEEDDIDYEAAPEFKDGRLIPDIKVPFDAMRKLNATVSVDIGKLQRESLSLTAVTLRARLQDGALHVQDAGLRNGDGWLRARAALEPAAGKGKATLAIQARKIAFGLVDPGDGPEPQTDIDINLAATGTDLRTLAANANGVLFADGHEYTIADNLYLKRLYGDLLNEILNTINPFAKSDTETVISCVVLPVEIANGQLKVNPEALVRTDKIRIVSEASIDLKTEKIEMTFRTTPRKGLTISAGEILNPFVMVVGTLAKPRLAVDAKGTLLSGGAAVATGGLSILAKATWERLNRSKNPCETAAQQGLEVLQDRFAEFPARNATQTQ